MDAMDIPDVGGMSVEGMDPKTALNQYCQRYCSRPVTKNDIVYMHTKFDVNQFQAIVKLNCMAGQEYAGEVCPSAKEAEKSAANQALQAYRAVALPAPQPRIKKKKSPGTDPETGEAVTGEEIEDAENPALTDKVRLNAACMRIVKRALQKGETVYACRQLSLGKVQDGFAATVQLPCLPGKWADRTFQGEACSNKQAAAQSAASVALRDIMADPEMSSLACKASAGLVSTTGAGKARGKGAKGQGWHWGKGWQDGPRLPRERVAEALVGGEVLEWKGTFGWIKPAKQPDHPAAERRGGKVYVHHQDLAGEASELQVGAQVQFLLYCDLSGLGAEQVTLT